MMLPVTYYIPFDAELKAESIGTIVVLIALWDHALESKFEKVVKCVNEKKSHIFFLGKKKIS